MTKKIFVAGTGGIGEAVALLAREWSKFETEIILGDSTEDNLRRAKDFVTRQRRNFAKPNRTKRIFEGKFSFEDL